MTSSERMFWTTARLAQTKKHRTTCGDRITTSLAPILLLLLSSGSVLSQATSNATVESSGAFPNVQARSDNFLSPDVASTVNLTSGGSKTGVESFGNEALGDDNNAVVSKTFETRDEEIAERQRSKDAQGEMAEVRGSLAGTEILPEFPDKDDRDDILNLEEEDDSREPTTLATTRRKMEESKGEENFAKDGSGEFHLNDIQRTNRENNFSLINDTNVNYFARKKDAGIGDDVIVLGEKVGNGSAASRLTSTGRVATTFGDDDESSSEKATTWTNSFVHGDEANRQSVKTATGSRLDADSENGKLPPKSLSTQNGGSTSFEPYPYARGGKIPENPSNGTEIPTSTEDASALENTIGLKDNNGESIVTAAGSPPSLPVDGVSATESNLQNPREKVENLWRTTLVSEEKDGDTTTPRIESTVARGWISNVSDVSESASLDYTGGVKIRTTTTDDESAERSTVEPANLNVTEVETTSPGAIDDSSSSATSPPTVLASLSTVTEESVRSEDPAAFPASTEASTTIGATPPNRTVGTTTSPISSSTATLERLTNDIAIDEVRETEDSSSSESSIESTTAGVEYEFVGLTESTSPKYAATTSTEGRSSASTSPLETLTLSPNSTSTTPDSSYPSTESSTLEEERLEETSTSPPTTADENETVDDSTVDGSSSEPPEVTESWSETAATTMEDSPVSGASLTTETIFQISTESGRSVDSSTMMIPEVSTALENSTSASVPRSESPEWSTDINETTESTSYPVTSANPSIVSPTEPSSWTPRYSDVRTEAEEKETAPSGPGGRAVSEDEATVLVRIIFEGTWRDVCPYLPALRQSLADLLTSGLEKTVLAGQIIYRKNPCTDASVSPSMTTEYSVTTLLLYVVDKKGNLDAEMTRILPSLYNGSPIKQQQIRTFQLVQDADSGNAIAVVVVSCVALICLVLLAGLLFIMRKRQTRFNYGERCRPVSLDAYSLDSVSAYNSVRGRKAGASRASKRSYGNPTFEDTTVTPSHPLNFAGLSAFCDEREKIAEEFATIPQVTARIDELPSGAEVKNRYANVVPLPETRVSLAKLGNDPLTEYINASYVRGPKNATRYYIACQAPIESTVTDFWRMIWEQQSKVVIMLTDLVENGVEKCAEYAPPSEVTDCHRLYGDYQVTLKKRETKERYAISTLHLKNLENNTFREVSHIWYLWPTNGVQSDAAGLIAVLLEARALQRGGPGPVVVHCSPGTGRTGTLIALDLAIRQYEITRTVDVPRVVSTIRRDRAGAVQTKEQYGFIYKALNLYATKLAGGALES